MGLVGRWARVEGDVRTKCSEPNIRGGASGHLLVSELGVCVYVCVRAFPVAGQPPRLLAGS